MTDADAILRQYLANGEMAQHNQDLLRPRPPAPPGRRAVLASQLDAQQTTDNRSELEISMQGVIDTALSQFPRLKQPETEYRFAAYAAGGPGKGVRQRLSDAGLSDWRFDFAWPDYMLAIEVEGGQWINGRHQRGKGYEDDCEKYNAAALGGWLLLRFTGDMVKDGRALASTIAALRLIEAL